MIHYIVMFVMMFIAGILSSMSIWADKFSHVRISLNDVYMSLLMCMWMLFFMGIWDQFGVAILIGFVGIIIMLFIIRNQLFINSNSYITSMIPHHSMAIFMSKQLLQKEPKDELKNFASNIVQTQEKEINQLYKL